MSELIHEYEVNIHWEEDRAGKLTAPGISQSVMVATPPEFPGGMQGILSPEHLFVASVSSCFMTTFLAIAENSKFEYENLDIQAFGSLVKEENKYRMSKITLKAVLSISDETLKEKGIRIMEKADAACLISRSIKAEVLLEPVVEIVTLHT